jgi:NADPH:quinone reductase-like Zn-dependent oxidoreductase
MFFKMSRNHAVVVQKPGEAAVEEVSIPKLRDDYILAKTKAVGLNLTDWKNCDFLTRKGTRLRSSGAASSQILRVMSIQLGRDYSRTVEEVGNKVTKRFVKGDRVCGFCHGAEHAPCPLCTFSNTSKETR